MAMTCPCQSGKDYAGCCQPLHQGQPAATPEALMRSRFSAFALGLNDYLLSSWHHSTRPASLAPEPGVVWKGLQIVSASQQGDTGTVHFRATCLERGRWSQLEEQSRFVREQGHWFYLDGDYQSSELATGRNDPCPCGSGVKFKKCCGR